MAKVKIKLNVMDFLLRKGELLAMGTAGFCLLVLLGWGASKWTSAKNPNEIAEGLANKSKRITDSIASDKATSDQLTEIQPAEFIVKPQKNLAAKTRDFPFTGPIFDPTGTPNTKRENPIVFVIEDFQVDLTRSAMPGYDIIYDNDSKPLIAVLTVKNVTKLDQAKVDAAARAIKAAAGRGRPVAGRKDPPPKQPVGPSPGPGGPHGLAGGGEFNANGRRDGEGKVIKYVPLDEIDKAVTEGNTPALTVIPVRLVTIHAVVPYKKQVEEIKRALRLATEADARSWGPWYDGFEIQRRETRMLPNGKEQIIQEWFDLPKDPKSTEGNYKFEEKYIETIDTRKIGDNFDEGFLPYFLKPDLLLSMPLPLLAPDLKVKYPEIRLKAILDNIEKLRKAATPEIPASELAKQIAGRGRDSIYAPRLDSSGGFGVENNFGGTRPSGPGVSPIPKINPPMGTPLPSGPGAPRRPDGFDTGAPPPPEVENFLLRFVDCNVKPGHTYEYRIRLRMLNPNYKQDKLVSNPVFAQEAYKMLYSKWLQLGQSISVPAESFLYAYDTKTYREQTALTYVGPENASLLNRLQIKDNQAVVQMAAWMPQVRTDAGGKHEPVGAWVVTEIPVGRGEYVGRKQYVKLPLWSSETQQYLLREVADKLIPTKGGKEQPQPKGWLVDFSTKSVLVDYEGGKVKTKVNLTFDAKGNAVPQTSSRTVEEEAATEMLIVRPDGKLVVRSSRSDDADENRKDVESKWKEWLKLVEARKAPTTGMGEPSEFAPKKP